MNEIKSLAHLDDSDIDEILGRTPPGERLSGIQTHVESCKDCRTRVERVRSLYGALSKLPRDGSVPDSIHGQLLRAPKRKSLMLPGGAMKIAAAAVLFATGMAVQSWTHAIRNPTTAEQPSSFGGSIPDATLAVQNAGTEYVAALARLNASFDARPQDRRKNALGREVAMSTLLGAVTEVARNADRDSMAVHAANAVRSARQSAIDAQNLNLRRTEN
jgi:hypothetical protein